MPRCVRCFNGRVTDPWKRVCDECWQWRLDNPITLEGNGLD